MHSPHSHKQHTVSPVVDHPVYQVWIANSGDIRNYLLNCFLFTNRSVNNDATVFGRVMTLSVIYEFILNTRNPDINLIVLFLFKQQSSRFLVTLLHLPTISTPIFLCIKFHRVSLFADKEMFSLNFNVGLVGANYANWNNYSSNAKQTHMQLTHIQRKRRFSHCFNNECLVIVLLLTKSSDSN